MRFVPHADLADTPNIIVDGAATPSTRLALSHWPKSGTPAVKGSAAQTNLWLP